MIGGWRPWQRWMVARRLARHARREGGEPPADLLRRLREDVPSSPALMRHPDRPPLVLGERRGTSRRWLAAASLAAALTAAVVGLRVWEQHPREQSSELEPASRPGGASAHAARLAKGEASPTAPVPAKPFDAATPPPRRPAGGVPAEPAMRRFAEQPTGQPTGAGGTADRTAAPSAATAGDEAARSPEALPPQLERTSRGGASLPPGRSASAAAAPSAGMPANDAAPAERARGTASPAPVPPAVPPPPPAAAAVERPDLALETKVEAAPPASPPSPRVAGASPLRSSFGADTGTDFYRRVRRGLLAEGRLPRAASVRADELANAFELAAEMPAVGRPELAVEGAPLPAAGATYLVRFEARGLTGRSSSDTVEVDFDPAVVARFRRVGATAHRGGAAALYEIELRPEAAAAPAAPGVMAGSRPGAAGKAMAPTAPKPLAETRPADTPRPAAASRLKAASPQPAAEPGAAAAPRRGGGTERVIATLRVVSRDEGGFQGGGLLAARVVRLDQLHPSWDAASPALRVQGLAVELAQALAAKDPGPRLQQVRVRAQALAAELPEDPKAAELLQLVDRAADLAGAAGGATPHPP
jgi:hypothetical protein